MPGQHAPGSPGSFILSLTRAGAGALAVLGVVALIVVVAVNSRGSDANQAAGGSPTPTATTSVEPTRSEDSPEPEPSPTEPTIRPVAKVNVRVLNGNRVPGLAGRTSDELEEAGYRMLEPGNAETTAETTIYYRKDAEAEAERLRRDHFDYVDVSQLQVKTGDLPSGLIIVVLGQDHPDA